ncbi:hypothetical protein [Bosea sp. 117]|nr:hypothetical protein [Bosea sp. 117]
MPLEEPQAPPDPGPDIPPPGRGDPDIDPVTPQELPPDGPPAPETPTTA